MGGQVSVLEALYRLDVLFSYWGNRIHIIVLCLKGESEDKQRSLVSGSMSLRTEVAHHMLSRWRKSSNHLSLEKQEGFLTF